MDTQKTSDFIKRLAKDHGFFYCGISKAEPLNEQALYLEKWLTSQKNGEMNWMENHFDLRVDPTKLFPGAKSIVSFALNYYPEERQNQDTFQISKYAYGRDYHKVIKKKLKHLMNDIKSEVGDISGRAFVDSAPIMDKVWAKKSGLGWMGKNTNIINKKSGSFFFLAEIVLDIELVYDGPVKDYCGTCTRCLDACPTGALNAPYEIDGSKCISYYTIELKDAIEKETAASFEDWIFGCDVCQDVCPWNRLSKPTEETSFKLKDELKVWSKKDWEELTEDVFDQVFAGTPVKRTGYAGLRRNIETQTK